MIKLNNITFKYDEVTLDNISLDIEKSKVTFIIGANGSGKSTLANIMSGLLYSKEGKVFIDDLEINKKTNNKEIRKKIGIVFQNPSNQILFSKVYDDIKFTLENINIDKNEIEDRIKKSLEKVSMIEHINANPYNLSGGQKQRIAIASQLALNPDYLILDEATSMLDINGKKDIYNLLKKLKKNMGIIVISNDMNELIYADDILVIDNHKIYKYTLKDILNNNNILKTHKLNIPFILKVANLLKITNIQDLTEENILKEIKKND